MSQCAVVINSQLIHHQLKQRCVGDTVGLINSASCCNMRVVIGLLTSQTVIGKEVPCLTHVLAGRDVACIVEVTHGRCILFHWFFTKEHSNRLECTVFYAGNITLHG